MKPVHTYSLSGKESDAITKYSLSHKESDPVTVASLTPAAAPKAVTVAAKRKAPAASRSKRVK
jgi:hypothetical protein